MEQIYTIPINEAFEKSAANRECGCPFCTIFKTFEENEIDTVLGASMMEPDIRLKTNELGFCEDHFSKLLRRGKKLPLALILESHIDSVANIIRVAPVLPSRRAGKTASKLSNLEKSCYVCDRLNRNFNGVMNNAAYLFATDSDFRKKCADQPYFCLPHYSDFLESAKAVMKGSQFNEFYKCVSSIELPYIKKIKDNLTAFTKKFDYRYGDEPWGEEKDAVERAIEALTGLNPTL